MNRKMKAKLANEAARRLRDCPKQGKMVKVPASQTECECGAPLGEPVALFIVPGHDRRSLH